MVVLTRFIAGPDSPTPYNSAQASPDAFSLADRVAAKESQQTGAALSGMFDSLAQSTQEKVDPVYVAQAKADMQVAYNDKLKAINSTAKAGGNYANDALQAFDGIASSIIQAAPNKISANHFAKSLIPMRTGAYEHGLKTQMGLDFQSDLTQYGQTTNNLMSLALQDPSESNINNIKGQISQYTQAMRDKGYDPKTVQAHEDSVFKNFDTIVANNMAQTNPNAAIQKLDAGQFAGLGPVEESRIRTKANAQFDAQVKTVADSFSEAKDRILTDRPVTQDFAQTLQKAHALSGVRPEIMNEAVDLAKLQVFADTMRTKPLADQQLERVNLGIQANTNPNLSSQEYKDRLTVLNNNIKTMSEDPLGYSVRHGLATLPPIPQQLGTPEAQDALQQRRLAAAAASTLTGTDALPMTQEELRQHSTALKSESPIEQAQHIGYLASIDPRVAPAMASALIDKGDSGHLSAALQIVTRDPAIAQKILEGHAMFGKGGLVKESDTDARARAAGDMQKLFPGDPETVKSFVQAGDAYRAANGENRLTANDVNKVAGIIKAGGFFSSYPTIPPRANMSGDEFNHLTSKLSMDDMIKFGNGTPSYSAGQVFDPAADSISNYQFKPTDPTGSKYYITNSKGQAMKNDNGSMYTIDLKTYLKNTK